MTLILNVLAVFWANPWGRTLLIGTGLFLWGVTKGWGWAAAGRDAAIQRAMSARDTYWQQQISKANRDHEAELSKAIEAAKAVPDITGGRDELIRLCSDPATNTDCRSKDVYGVPRVPPDHVGR